MPRLLSILLLCLLAAPTVAAAQDNPYSTFNKFAYSRVKDILLR
jgi:hypothetical protein